MSAAPPVSLTAFGQALVVLLFFVVPLAIGLMVLRRSRGVNRPNPMCGRCGYDVTGTIGQAARCPECGSEFAQVGILPVAARRNPVMLFLGVALLGFPLTCGGGMLALHAARSSRMAATAPIPAPRPVPIGGNGGVGVMISPPRPVPPPTSVQPPVAPSVAAATRPFEPPETPPAPESTPSEMKFRSRRGERAEDPASRPGSPDQ